MNARVRQNHTVKAVAELSGVSVRTLRFYDQIGLLKPAFTGENGYRYYGREQLLLLQQILFYRELGLELATIKEILGNPEFDLVVALRSHREKLRMEEKRVHALLRTIDRTLAHIEKESPMKDEEMYDGFDPEKQAQHERELIDRYGEHARKNIAESKKRTAGWKREQYEQVNEDYDELHRLFADALRRGVAPGDEEAQQLVRRHYSVVDRFWTPNRETYIGLGVMYCEHPDFRRLYDAFDPGLADYLAEAMKVFAERELS